ncbi:MAG: oligosaccharide flippase family protein [Fusobacterium sp. JB021]|nr:oligosaccharide flippase family protein [Fusobacterium sp. JB021]MDP0507225.1 oligosaccharide flippase family protein [Fusobacterium sp. JB019]
MFLKKVYKGMLINFICTFIPCIISFIVNKYFVEFMGIEYLGLMRLFTQLLAYLGIVEMGLGSASAYSLYKPLAEKDYRRLNIVISTISSLYKKIAFFILIMGLVLVPFLKFFIKDINITNMIILYWILYLTNTVLNYLFIKYNILFTANQEYNFVRVVQASTRILSQILKIYVILRYKSFLLFISCILLETGIQYLLFKKYYNKNYSFIKKTKIRDKIIVKNLKNLFFHRIGELVVFNTDLILISKFISLKTVGVYASYRMLIKLLKMSLNVITGVLSPMIGRFVAIHSDEENFNLWKKINIVYVFMGVIGTYCFYELSTDFVIIWIGKENTFIKETVFLLSVNLYIIFIRCITEKFKNSYGFFDDIQLPILESILNFSVSLILVIKIGLNGVIIGTIVSDIFVILILKPILVFKRCFKKSIGCYARLYLNYIFLSIISILLVSNIVNKYFDKNISDFYDWTLKGFEIFILTTIISLLIFLSNNDFRKGIKNIFKDIFKEIKK